MKYSYQAPKPRAACASDLSVCRKHLPPPFTVFQEVLGPRSARASTAAAARRGALQRSSSPSPQYEKEWQLTGAQPGQVAGGAGRFYFLTNNRHNILKRVVTPWAGGGHGRARHPERRGRRVSGEPSGEMERWGGAC